MESIVHSKNIKKGYELYQSGAVEDIQHNEICNQRKHI